MDRLGPKGDVLFAGTFAGHTLDVAVALEVTRIVREGAIHRHLGAARASGSRRASRRPSTRPARASRCASRPASGRSISPTQPIRRFRDFARFAMDKDHPIQRAYRGWLLERGIYVHPHYMIRGFLTGAHTDADVDRLVEATAEFLAAHRESSGRADGGRAGEPRSERSGAVEDRRA